MVIIHLLHILAEGHCENQRPQVDAVIWDGSAVIHMLVPKACRNFKQYMEDTFIPYVTKSMIFLNRLDIVWDKYIEGSLKRHTRYTRGKGQAKLVKENAPIPSNWMSFLRNNENKTGLFEMLALSLETISIGAEKTICCSYKDSVIINTRRDNILKEDMTTSSHEEADTRIFCISKILFKAAAKK